MPTHKDSVKFYLHSSSITTKIKIVDDLRLNTEQPVKVLIHGWMDNKDSFWYEPAVKAYLQKGGVNVITVDWGKHARGLFTLAVKHTKNVGKQIGDLIIEVSKKYGIPPSQFHLVGHSLGAHISGFAGKTVSATQGTKVGRITALDPAGPLFTGKTSEDRLSSDDAIFVDVIHTDGGHLGFEKSIGQADFFPCGGKRPQNGCGKIGGDSHNRAPLYFVESITSTNFVAIKVANYQEFESGKYTDDNKRAVMGENCDPTTRGNFYLYTFKKPLYARGTI